MTNSSGRTRKNDRSNSCEDEEVTTCGWAIFITLSSVKGQKLKKGKSCGKPTWTKLYMYNRSKFKIDLKCI